MGRRDCFDRLYTRGARSDLQRQPVRMERNPVSAQLPLVFPAAETLHFVDARELREAAPADALRGLREGGVARRRPRLLSRQRHRVVGAHFEEANEVSEEFFREGPHADQQNCALATEPPQLALEKSQAGHGEFVAGAVHARGVQRHADVGPRQGRREARGSCLPRSKPGLQTRCVLKCFLSASLCAAYPY